MATFIILLAIMVFLWYKADKWSRYIGNNKENDNDL